MRPAADVDFFHRGHLRLDWGFGNPNKTAVLIAVLMVLAWWPARKWRQGFWISLALNLALGACLIHTYSRGGAVAAVIGLGTLWAADPVLRRSLNRTRLAALAVSLMTLVAYANFDSVDAGSRFVQGIAEEDRSISNRLEIWSKAPRMMIDAPTGWGLGRSGWAYTQWYQPKDTRLEYRTLVNSHLTWLVEFGWLARAGYLLAWCTLLWVAWWGRRHGGAITLGAWLAFALGAWFSSVAESGLLWLPPALALLPLAMGLWRERPPLPSRLRLARVPAAALILTGLLALVGSLTPAEVSIRGSATQLVCGTGKTKVLLVNPDPAIVGTHYGITIRTSLATEGGQRRWLVLDHADPSAAAWPRAEVWILSGSRVAPDPEGQDGIATASPDSAIDPKEIPAMKAGAKSLVYLNPSRLSDLKLAPSTDTIRHVTVVGSLRVDRNARTIRNLAPRMGWSVVPASGAREFIPDWLDISFIRNLKSSDPP